MAGGGGGRSMEETATWAVAVVCFILLVISFIIEYVLHFFGEWLKKKHKNALYEAFEKVKSELMMLGFISLLLVVWQRTIADICIHASVADSWSPCNDEQKKKLRREERKLLQLTGKPRFLAGSGYGSDKCTSKGKVSLMSAEALNQLHIFIFVLAVSHVLYCMITMVLGGAKMRRWKAWEKETKTTEYMFLNDAERFRFARETSFGRRHMRYWTKNPILLWIVCFFRQFVRSLPKVDYLTLRHGFVMAHLAPQSQVNFDFQKYIKRSLENEFKTVVGISPLVWFFAVLYLLFNTNGWYAYIWRPFIPLIMILLVGTKLQVIITKLGLRIEKRGEVVQGVPMVVPADDLFWFSNPRLILYLINFALFQNVFQLAFFAWSWYEFGIKSCFNLHMKDVILRISMGVIIQFLSSYVTLPLYALVTQMGTNMKPTVFDEKVATALRRWHHGARSHLKAKRKSGSTTPSSHQGGGRMSPVHLLRDRYRSDIENSRALPSSYEYSNYWRENDGDGSTTRYASSYYKRRGDGSLSSHNCDDEYSPQPERRCNDETTVHEIGTVIELDEFSFNSTNV